MSLINNTFVQKLIYWILNVISPSINAQAIITYILAKESKFCRLFIDSDFSIFRPIGDDTIGVNWVLLFIHIVILLVVIIAIDCGYLKFPSSLSCLTLPLHFDENTLDNDVLAERHRILKQNGLASNKTLLNTDHNEEEHVTDYLTVNDLVKRFPGRNVCAVNHLAFGAKRGEAFGLLGYNVSYKKIFLLIKI